MQSIYAEKGKLIVKNQLRYCSTAISAVAVIITTAVLAPTPPVEAQSGEDDHDSRIEIGFRIGPVPLNLNGKDRLLVGLSLQRLPLCRPCDPICAGWKSLFRPADENKSSDLPGRWTGLRSPKNGARLTAYCRPQLDPRQNRASSWGAIIL